MRDWSYGRRNIRLLNTMLVLAIDSLKIGHAKIAVYHKIFTLSPHHRNCEWHAFPFFIFPITQVLNTCFAANMGCTCLVLVSKLNSKVTMICLLHKSSYLSNTTRKNHITTYIAEPVRMIFTFAIHSLSIKNPK